MAIIRNLVVKIGADISGLQRGLKQAQNGILTASNVLAGVGRSISLRVTAPLSLLGSQAVKTAGDFEQSMANAASVAMASAEDLERMTKLARNMGKSTVFSASQAADGLYYMASAGYKVEQMENALEPILNLAAATQSDLAFSTDTVIATLNQFGLGAEDASRVSNTFASAIGNSQATLEKLGYSMRYVGPVAHSLGYSLEDTTAALGVLYNAGFKGEQAGTILRGALSRLLKPTAAINKALAEVGLTYEDINPSTHKLVDIIGELEKAEITTAQAVQIFGQEAGPGMMAMIGQGSKALEDMTNKITNTNSASDMANMQINTLQGSAKLMKSMMEVVAITIGNILLPIMNKFMKGGMMPLIDKFDKLSLEMKETVVKIGVLVASIGPAITILSKVIKVMSLIPKILSAITSPVGMIIVAISALVGILTYLWKTNEEFREIIIKTWTKIKDSIVNAITTIRTWWDKNGDFIKTGTINIFTTVWETILKAGEIIKTAFLTIKQALIDLWSSNQDFRDMVVSLWLNIKETIMDVVTKIKDWWSENGEAILAKTKEIFEKLIAFVGTAFNNLWESFKVFFSYVEPIWNQLKKLIASLWDVFKDLLEVLKPVFELLGALFAGLEIVAQGVLNGIIQALGPFIQALLDLAQIVTDVVGVIVSLLKGDLEGAFTHLQNVGTGFKDFFGHIWEGIKNLTKGFVDSIINLFGALDIDIVGKVKSMATKVKDWFKNMWQGAKDWCGHLFDTVAGIFTKIKDTVWNVIKDAFNWGANLMQMVADGIKSGIEWVGDKIKSVGKKIKDFLGFHSPTKEGPARDSDTWMPNMMNMFAKGIETNIPDIQSAVNEVGLTLASVGGMSTGISAPMQGDIGSDIVNALLKVMTVMNQGRDNDNQKVELEIDGNTFARLIMPSITREFKRNGIILKEV